MEYLDTPKSANVPSWLGTAGERRGASMKVLTDVSYAVHPLNDEPYSGVSLVFILIVMLRDNPAPTVNTSGE